MRTNHFGFTLRNDDMGIHSLVYSRQFRQYSIITNKKHFKPAQFLLKQVVKGCYGGSRQESYSKIKWSQVKPSSSRRAMILMPSALPTCHFISFPHSALPPRPMPLFRIQREIDEEKRTKKSRNRQTAKETDLEKSVRKTIFRENPNSQTITRFILLA